MPSTKLTRNTCNTSASITDEGIIYEINICIDIYIYMKHQRTIIASSTSMKTSTQTVRHVCNAHKIISLIMEACVLACLGRSCAMSVAQPPRGRVGGGGGGGCNDRAKLTLTAPDQAEHEFEIKRSDCRLYTSVYCQNGRVAFSPWWLGQAQRILYTPQR
jgi:hypothetical protein